MARRRVAALALFGLSLSLVVFYSLLLGSLLLLDLLLLLEFDLATLLRAARPRASGARPQRHASNRLPSTTAYGW